MSRLRYTDLIRSIPATTPFVGPEAMARNGGYIFRARIGANEGSFGPSPKAIAAMERAASQVWKYADPENHDLKHALAEHYQVPVKNIVVGEGIDGLLGLGVRLFTEPGVSVVMADGAYPTFGFHVTRCGGDLIKVPYVDDRESLGDLAATSARAEAAICYFTNPDNPMGTWWSAQEQRAFLDSLPADTALFLDEAYVEFAPDDAVLPIDVCDPRLIRFRTFSKAYGMAGARIAYVIAHEDVIAQFDKIRNQYGVNMVAQAGALAALQDREWLSHVVRETAAARARIVDIAQENGLTAIPSATNFVTLDCGRDHAFAKSVLEVLLAQGIFIRMPFSAPGNRCIRIGAGLPHELDAFAEALPSALGRAESAGQAAE